jgi:SAM-dependent methyltransferase
LFGSALFERAGARPLPKRYDARVPAAAPSHDPYDRLPYTEHAYAESHPDRLAVIARLTGWQPPEVTTARILELGCGRGGNLLPMAAALPTASLVGMDRSLRQVEDARAVAAAAELANVRFCATSFDEPRSDGPFDYVLSHGVCSWVAPAARRALLRAIATGLAPGGVAYVSFNVLPGWYERMPARDWLRTTGPEDPRSSLEWLRDQVSPELADYRRRLDAVARRLAETEAAYAAHEYLAGEHHPQLVSTLLAEAGESGLAYVGDAIFSETALELLPDAVRERARSLEVAAAQQLVDFVRNTAFRRAIFVRADDARSRGWKWPPEADVVAIDALRVASRLRPHGAPAPSASVERFDGADVSVHVRDPAARAALRELARVAPRSLPFPDLARLAGASHDAAALRQELLDLWLATGAVDLHAHEPALANGSSARPAACPVARYHATRGGPVTNRWHQEVRLDSQLRNLLGLLDGTRTHIDLERDSGGSPDGVRAGVAALAAAALLVC